MVTRLASTLPEGRSRELSAKVHDVSRDGMGFLSREPFDRDEVVRVTIDFGRDTGEGRGFVTEGVVQTCTPGTNGDFRVGIALKKRTGRDLQTWHDIIQRWRVFLS